MVVAVGFFYDRSLVNQNNMEIWVACQIEDDDSILLGVLFRDGLA